MIQTLWILFEVLGGGVSFQPVLWLPLVMT